MAARPSGGAARQGCGGTPAGWWRDGGEHRRRISVGAVKTAADAGVNSGGDLKWHG